MYTQFVGRTTKQNRVIKIYDRQFNLAIVSCIAITLYFNPNFQDPFNTPKFIILALFGAWVLGLLVANIPILKLNKPHKILIVILGIFTIFNYISLINSKNTFVSFFGESQRKTGALTYTLLALLFLFSSLSFKYNQKNTFYKSVIFTGFLTSSYGLMQHYDQDFIAWNNPYNSVISTLGNPNFAAAIMAILGILLFGILFDSEVTFLTKLFAILCLIEVFITIIFSNARQGMLTLILGVSLIVLIQIYSISKKVGFVLTVGFALILVIAALGVLNSGPLANLLYKPSVSIRGYYWKAGLEMFRDNFWLGVGPDMYGYYFKQYREVDYVLNYGFMITSTNAHNVPIQIFATGGFIVGITYVLLLLFILFSGIRAIKINSGHKRTFASLVFASWVGYQAQSMVSIDNLGISIWGWVIGGVIVKLSVSIKQREEVSSLESKTVRNGSRHTVLSSFLTLLMIFLCSLIYRGELATKEVYRWFNPANAQNKTQFYAAAQKTLNLKLLDPSYRISVGSLLPAMGFVSEGLTVLKAEHDINPLNLDCLNILAGYSEQIKDFTSAISYREKIRKIDRWNADNLLQLGRSYKINGDLVGMEKIKQDIASFAADTIEGKTASLELN